MSVIDPTRCDAQTTIGCRARVPKHRSGPRRPQAADPAVATAYVANGASTVAMINTSTCNAHRPAGCGETPPTVTVGAYPSAVALDPVTHTVYVANHCAGADRDVSVFDDRSLQRDRPVRLRDRLHAQRSRR